MYTTPSIQQMLAMDTVSTLMDGGGHQPSPWRPADAPQGVWMITCFRCGFSALAWPNGDIAGMPLVYDCDELSSAQRIYRSVFE